MYDDLCVQTFLEKQLQLFPEVVAETEEEALYFLEDVCAVVCDSEKEVIAYMKDSSRLTPSPKEVVGDSPP